MVREYHVHKAVWELYLGDSCTIITKNKQSTLHDKYVVAVLLMDLGLGLVDWSLHSLLLRFHSLACVVA